MSVIVNKNTQQTPIVAGKTGTQSIKLIPAGRVYMRAQDIPAVQQSAVSNGVTPAGWTDLGIIDGNAKITYTKKTKEIRTGLDQSLRAIYTELKTAQVEFTLQQFDDVTLENLTGFTASQLTSGSIYNFQIGQEDVLTKALLIVVQNKLDGKEFQFYNPGGFITFQIDEANDGLVFKVTGELPSFVAAGQTVESFISVTEFRTQ